MDRLTEGPIVLADMFSSKTLLYGNIFTNAAVEKSWEGEERQVLERGYAANSLIPSSARISSLLLLFRFRSIFSR